MKCLYTVLLIVGGSIAVTAQSKKSLDGKVSLELDSVKISALVNAIERQQPVFFYYDSAGLSGINLSVHVKDKPLDEALSIAFDTSGLFFSADDDGHIFITVGQAISMNPGITTLKPGGAAATLPGRALQTASPPTAGTFVPPARLSSEDNKLYTIGTASDHYGEGKATLSGYIRHNETGEGISGASIAVEGTPLRVISDQYGYYVVTLPRGARVLHVSYLGMADTRRKLRVFGDGKLNVRMDNYVTALKEVRISGEKSSNVRSTVVGMQKVDIKTVKELPRLMGEADVVRVLQTLPGVTSVGEGSTGMNVRGGAVDQNLVMFDGATIFSPSHFFGFFSGFNAGVVKDAELYKSSIPARYGGRLSSVLEVVTREGNREKFSGSGGIGPLSGNLTLEGPIGKKTTFIAGGRSTYSDWALNLLDDDRYKNSSAAFYDLNAKITHRFNDRNTLYLSGYWSKDRFKLDGDTLYRYGNRNAVLKWKHFFNDRAFGLFSAGYDYYDFDMESDRSTVNDFRFRFNISQLHANYDLVYTLDNTHKLTAGLSATRYELQPGEYRAVGKGQALPRGVQGERGLDAAAYIGDLVKVSADLSVDLGLRFNYYSYLGPHDVYSYIPGAPREVNNITDTVTRSGNIKGYMGLEPRVALRYSLNGNTSIKLAYNRTRQNIHMLSNTTAISPLDTWKLSDEFIKPGTGDQLALGLYKNFRDNSIETSVEVYYKRIRHAVTYKNNAELFLNDHIETDIANANGRAYGIEFLVKKTSGKLNGWFAYTYSRTELQMDDPLVPEPINGGAYFPADYDKPHVVNLVANYKVSHRFSMSLLGNYSTGRPITLPVARYYYGGSYRVLYSNRNAHRVPGYFRTDFSVNIEGSHKRKKLAHSSFTLGVYNLTGRRNPYSVYYISEEGKVNGYKLSIFGSAIPFATYNFKF